MWRSGGAQRFISAASASQLVAGLRDDPPWRRFLAEIGIWKASQFLPVKASSNRFKPGPCIAARFDCDATPAIDGPESSEAKGLRMMSAAFRLGTNEESERLPTVSSVEANVRQLTLPKTVCWSGETRTLRHFQP